MPEIIDDRDYQQLSILYANARAQRRQLTHLASTHPCENYAAHYSERADGWAEAEEYFRVVCELLKL